MTMINPHALRSYLRRPNRLRQRASGSGPWTVPDLCSSYQWPQKLVGGGVIAIIELGGGWLASDVAAYFAGIKQPVPSIVDVSVDATKNDPGKSDADGEVALDIQVAGAAYYCATGKAATIRVYWCQDIAQGVLAALKDGCDVCSISWGADEADWGKVAGDAMEAAAQAATAAGMVVFAAAGDNDSSDGGAGAANVDLPAGCPHIIGCGGTNKTRALETVWNNNPGQTNGEGTGGGYSTLFAFPAWQASNGAPKGPGRLVPDVAANADPDTGYEIIVNGQAEVVGGTSAVAPLYAGLFAAFGRKLGWAGEKLWATGSRGAFSDVTQGDNGMFHAAAGPDPCTGLGAPIGAKIDAVLVAATQPTPAPTPTPGTATVAEAIAWASSQIPAGFTSGSAVRKLIERGLTAHAAAFAK